MEDRILSLAHKKYYKDTEVNTFLKKNKEDINDTAKTYTKMFNYMIDSFHKNNVQTKLNEMNKYFTAHDVFKALEAEYKLTDLNRCLHRVDKSKKDLEHEAKVVHEIKVQLQKAYEEMNQLDRQKNALAQALLTMHTDQQNIQAVIATRYDEYMKTIRDLENENKRLHGELLYSNHRYIEMKDMHVSNDALEKEKSRVAEITRKIAFACGVPEHAITDPFASYEEMMNMSLEHCSMLREEIENVKKEKVDMITRLQTMSADEIKAEKERVSEELRRKEESYNHLLEEVHRLQGVDSNHTKAMDELQSMIQKKEEMIQLMKSPEQMKEMEEKLKQKEEEFEADKRKLEDSLRFIQTELDQVKNGVPIAESMIQKMKEKEEQYILLLQQKEAQYETELAQLRVINEVQSKTIEQVQEELRMAKHELAEKQKEMELSSRQREWLSTEHDNQLKLLTDKNTDLHQTMKQQEQDIIKREEEVSKQEQDMVKRAEDMDRVLKKTKRKFNEHLASKQALENKIADLESQVNRLQEEERVMKQQKEEVESMCTLETSKWRSQFETCDVASQQARVALASEFGITDENLPLSEVVSIVLKKVKEMKGTLDKADVPSQNTRRTTRNVPRVDYSNNGSHAKNPNEQ